MFTRALPVIITFASLLTCGISASAQESGPVTTPDNSSPVSGPAVSATGSGSRDVLTMAAGMYENATLMNAIRACGLESGLRRKSSITIFAPSNLAFSKLPPGMVDQLLKPENASILSKIISYHIVEGNHNSASMREAIKAARGRAVFTTLSGNQLVATIEDNKIKLTDDGNNACFLTMTDIKGSNGTVHMLDKVALPR